MGDTQQSSLKHRVAWLLTGKLFAFALGVVLPLLLVRRMSQAEFGLYKQVFLVVATATGILPFGFGMTVYYFFPRLREQRSAVVLNVLLFYLFVGTAALLLFTATPQVIASTLIGDEVAARNPSMRAELASLVPLVGVVVFFWLISSFLESAAIANDETKHATAFIVLAQFTKSTLLVGAAAYFGSVRALLIAALLQGVLQTVMLIGYLASRFPGFWRSFEWTVLKRQAMYAAPYSFAAVTWTLQTDMHNYFVSHYFGQIGFAVYAVGVFQLPFVGLLCESVAAVMIPQVSYLQSIDDRPGIVRLAAASARKLGMLILPAYAFLIVAGHDFIVALFTEQYAASSSIFRINLTLLPLSIIPLDAVCRAYEELGRFFTKVRVISLPLLAGLLWAISPWGDLRAVALTTAAFYTGECMIGTYRAARTLDVRFRDLPRLGDIGKILLASAVAGLTTLAVRHLALASAKAVAALAMEAAVFGTVYAVCVFALKILSSEETASISDVWRTLLLRFRWTTVPAERS